MSPHSSRSGDSDEISAVIKALREADLRLEELTAGEVDTVSDHEVRAFMLQRARNQLRDTEAANQEPILNAPPAYIAGLDAAGRILPMRSASGRYSVRAERRANGTSRLLRLLNCDEIRGTGSDIRCSARLSKSRT